MTRAAAITSSFFIWFLSFRFGFPGRLCFDLSEIMFYCKETGETAFPGEKKSAGINPARKTIFMKESKTIAEGLGKYAIGAKLRRLRLRKSMGLLELSKHTSLSPALLSKL